LQPGSYHVLNYPESKDLGTVDVAAGAAPKLKTQFRDHLLLEVSR
jgi:hypothetical protein